MNSNNPNLGPRPGVKLRKSIALSQENLVTERFFNEFSLPLVMQPNLEGLSLPQWASGDVDVIKQKLLKFGAILFRGFKMPTLDEFQEFLGLIAGDLLDYSYRSTPRTQVSGKIYTSTEYPAHQIIPLHNEMSYSRQWPMVLGFFCVQPSLEGGETPIADSRKVFNRIDPAVVNRFAQKQVRYVRNYGDDLDLSWQDVFQTTDRTVVEEFCRSQGIELEWKANNRLYTSQSCQAVATHPLTNESVWFNQAHLFHISSLDPEVRAALMESTAGELPRNTVFADGSDIQESDLENVRAAYKTEIVSFPWQQGDVLLVDNMLVAHGRNAYRGERKIVVGMGQLYGADPPRTGA